MLPFRLTDFGSPVPIHTLRNHFSNFIFNHFFRVLFSIIVFSFGWAPLAAQTGPDSGLNGQEDPGFYRNITFSLAEPDVKPAHDAVLVTGSGRSLRAGHMEAVMVSDVIAVPAGSADPFLGIAGSWDAETPDPHLIDIDFRTSADGESWSGWIRSGFDHHTKADSERYHSNLVFTDKNTRFVQYRLTLKRSEEGLAPLIHSLTLHFISPGATSDGLEAEIGKFRPENRQARSQESATDELTDAVVYPLPEYVDRATWGQALGLTNTASRSITTVTHLIVHHSASDTDASDFAAVVRSYWNFHVNGRNWSDIGYNWLVDGNGVIYQGRAYNTDGNRNVIGAHFSGFNANTMGICVIGNYNNRMPTGDALGSLNEMLAWKSSELDIDPQGRAQHYSPGGNIHRISGHRDSTIPTDCPGHQLYGFLPQVRQGVADLLDEFFTPVDYYIQIGRAHV